MTIDYKIGVKKLQYINRDAGIMSALLLTGLDMRRAIALVNGK